MIVPVGMESSRCWLHTSLWTVAGPVAVLCQTELMKKTAGSPILHHFSFRAVDCTEEILKEQKKKKHLDNKTIPDMAPYLRTWQVSSWPVDFPAINIPSEWNLDLFIAYFVYRDISMLYPIKYFNLNCWLALYAL